MHKSINFLLFLFFLLSVNDINAQIVDTISIQKANELIATDTSLVVVDCRDSVSFRLGHLPGAIHLDVYDKAFVEKLNKFDKSKAYMVYCRTNGRSGIFCDQMIEDGFSQIYWFKGKHSKSAVLFRKKKRTIIRITIDSPFCIFFG